jgi:hypothetical protein
MVFRRIAANAQRDKETVMLVRPSASRRDRWQCVPVLYGCTVMLVRPSASRRDRGQCVPVLYGCTVMLVRPSASRIVLPV